MVSDPSLPSVFRSLQRGARLLLVIATAIVVASSFGYVIFEAVNINLKDRGKTTLTILHWGTPQEDAIVRQLCDRYLLLHPDVAIDRINASDFDSKLKTMMAAGTPPDLFYLPRDLTAELVSLKLIRPVDDFVHRDMAAGKGEYLREFYPIVVDAFRYDPATDRSGVGSLYALPKDFTTTLIYVNLDLFKAAGVPVPYNGWTWNEFEADMKKITALNNQPEFSGRRIFGGNLELGADRLQSILWSFGGSCFGKTFRDVELDSPASQQALQAIARMRLQEKVLFNSTGLAKNPGQEFLIGDIGCWGPVGRWEVPVLKDVTKFKWDVVPLPYKSKSDQVSEIITTGWAMSSATKDPERCFDLMKFLCSAQGAVMQSRLGLAIPPLKPVAESADFLSPSGLPKMHARIFLDAIRYARLPRVPREAEWSRIVEDKIARSLQLGEVSTLQNAKEIKQAWLDVLNSPLRRRQWPPMRWGLVIAVVGTVFAAIVLSLAWRVRREKLGPLDRAQERSGWAFISPWLLGFAALTLGPMIVSLLLSFGAWTGMTPISSVQSVGVANYTQMLSNDPTFYHSLRVTIYFVLLSVPIGQAAALAVALLMNTPVRGVTIFRTIFFVPSVVSGVALAVLWLQIFNNDYGLMNEILRPITHLFGREPPDWFGRDAAGFAIPAFVIMGLWGVGGGMILYLAGLKGIPGSLYEASRIDGAGAMRRFWNITLPMLSPLLFYNVVMGIIGSFQIFTQAYVIQGANDSTLFYVLNLYRNAFEFHNMGYASAMAWVLFVIVLALTIAVFRGSKNLVYYEGLRT